MWQGVVVNQGRILCSILDVHITIDRLTEAPS